MLAVTSRREDFCSVKKSAIGEKGTFWMLLRPSKMRMRALSKAEMGITLSAKSRHDCNTSKLMLKVALCISAVNTLSDCYGHVVRIMGYYSVFGENTSILKSSAISFRYQRQLSKYVPTSTS